MGVTRRLRLSGPPLALQIVGLLLGGLIVAQLVTLFLTMLLPPAPQPQYGLDGIAKMLSGAAANSSDTRALRRNIQAGPPALIGPGWLTSERSRHDLAEILGRDEADVRLYFFTPLPFAGTAAAPQREAGIFSPATVKRRVAVETHHLPPGFIYADYQVAQIGPGQARFPGGGFPGGFPGGGFPGGGVPGGSVPGGGGIPAGGLPGSHMPAGPISQPPAGAPATTAPAGPVQMPQTSPAANPARSSPPNTPTNAQPQSGSASASPESAKGSGGPNISEPIPAIPHDVGRPDLPGMTPRGQPTLAMPVPAIVIAQPDVTETRNHPAPRRPRERAPHNPVPGENSQPRKPSVSPPSNETAGSGTAQIPASAAAQPSPSASQVKRPSEPSVLVVAPSRGLFGLAPAPFVEGDFVAALRLSDGRWAVVQPAPEPFPNSWQRRLLLWFAISFALVAPSGWIFARRLVRPIAGFAYAAEQLGRDPTASISAMEGPAEVGRAAHAFNRMQSRLRNFVDDRTAMVGAISHDLRTPLTRLRFRIEDVPDDLREGMLAEVDEMEQMISSVLAFIRDASEPGLRETLDLRSIIEDVVEDAVFVGKRVTLEVGEHAEVEADPLGMRRLLGNLVENAVKYGDVARVRLFKDHQEAVAEIRDNGPGLPDDELERVFQPFYRAPAARNSNKHGTGLGLAVCRSIARAHGGDVQLKRGDQGLIAQLRLPLAYGANVS